MTRTHSNTIRLFALALTAATASLGTLRADAPAAQAAKPAIVLVHGAFADGTSWQRVIPILEKDGYSVTAVQNPLSSLADDVATTKRVLDAQKGPVVVVGHSYGGSVITDAAAGNPNVKALVYIAAYAPETDETIITLNAKFSAPELATSGVPDAAGFLYVDRTKFHAVFCADVPEGEARIMAATQKPLNSAAFGEKVTGTAWKTIPTWYLVSQDDKAINPDLERFFAKRMNARTSEVKASHVPFISQPKVVAALIEQAAEAASK